MSEQHILPSQISPLPQLVAFDLDDTLAESKARLAPRMVTALARLIACVPVCVISGGNYAQFENQLLGSLNDLQPAPDLTQLHLMPTCGTQYYRRDTDAGEWVQVYSQPLSDDEKQRSLTSVESVARELGYWESETWGPILEDRESQITFSALGQKAPVDAKAAWDPTGEKKLAIRSRVAELLPDLEVRAGGSTSIDITRKGIDKAFGITRLAEMTGIGFTDMLFVGDRLDPGGNDYPVKQLGVPCYAVENWEETAAYIERLVIQLEEA